MRKLRLLDLCCGAGGASMGYHLAGFQVTGVDIEPQANYPFTFVQRDVMDALGDAQFLRRFDAIHASPPCQNETSLRSLHRDRDYPMLLGPVIDKLSTFDVPWIVENVEATKRMTGSQIICGASLGLGARCRDGIRRPLKRHRRFLTSFPFTSAPCACYGQPIGVYGHGGGGHYWRGRMATVQEARDAMGITWMTRTEMSQAIPPAYTRLIGMALRDHLRATKGHGSRIA